MGGPRELAIHHLRYRGKCVLDDDAADSLGGWIQVATQCGHHEVILDLMQWKDENENMIHATLEGIFAETDGLEQLVTVFAMMGDSGDVETMESIRDGLWNMAKQMEDDLNQRISAGMESASLDLTGSDMLEALADAATFS